MRRAARLAAAIFGALSFSASSQAATTTSSFQVTITIQADCQITSTNTLAFGTTGVILADVDSSANLGVQCTNTTPYNIGLNAGTGSGATVTTRKMTGPASATVNYSLYTDSGRTTVWGNTVGTDTVASTGNGSAQTHAIYGRVAAQSTPAPGSYTDTITVTVSF